METNAAFSVQGTKYDKADKSQLAILFKYLEGCLEQIVKDNELGALKQALKVDLLSYPGLHHQRLMILSCRALYSNWTLTEIASRLVHPDYGMLLDACRPVIPAAEQLSALSSSPDHERHPGMQGGYVEPGPGGDPIRNPGVLPTGKNIHALDPQSIPTQAAVKSAKVVVERCSPAALKDSLPA